ncbi:amidase family protein [Maritimibacter sp. UBA3975]|uniref:amidase n=1 Tax=Maritimibacter sp. UBA3975 TaxID=1946833 RepID=UPI000C0A0900|nr:amidase family protein [Maritimibacter sp. UBA3975]MAM62489.1 amidase [Maritimibacter sp.]|tara:strand:+ start:25220 stop:26548 length:1329 start_codon:yes stop_codon:yes gene_type:complete
MSDDWLWMSAADLGRGIGAGRIDPVALAEAHLDAAEAHPDGTRIYARLTRERALAEAGAAAARARAGQRLGPLDGVPVSWKDLFDTAGVATEAGSALLRDRVPERDAEVLATATLGGLVCLGKTHMSEFAFSGLGLNPITATPPNIHDPQAAPGGSSSGAAASVAHGLAPAGIGSDTGGSVRVPSAWNDLVGLKTTHGRLSLRGVVPLAARFDTVGPLCRTVEDAGLLLAALEGGRPADLTGATLSNARLLVLENGLADCRDAPAAAFETAVSRLSKAGAQIDRAHIPELDSAQSMSGVLYTTEAWGTWGDRISADPDAMFARIRERFEAGGKVSGADYVAAWRRLDAIRETVRARAAGYDALILPTTPNMPPNARRLLDEDDYYVTENLMTLRNTRFGNLLEGASLTLPTDTPGAGLMFLGKPMGEERLLRLGAAAEAALA